MILVKSFATLIALTLGFVGAGAFSGTSGSGTAAAGLTLGVGRLLVAVLAAGSASLAAPRPSGMGTTSFVAAASS